jgi:hypothetical protein
MGSSGSSGRRRTQIRRRRAVASAAVLVVVVTVIAVVVVGRGGGMRGQGGGGPVSDGAASAGDRTGVTAITAEASIDPAARAAVQAAAQAVGANELGMIPVLMYTRIASDMVPPERLRSDIEALAAAGFYPTTVREMVEGTMDVPAGKSPVILTFDDSSPTQYRLDDSASIDPDCAVAIMQEAVNARLWASKATFYPLLEVNQANILFGQPEYAEQKVRDLVDWGYEIGSHTTNHRELSLETADEVQSELARSKASLERIAGGGYEVFSLAPPYGELPHDLTFLVAGEYGGYEYTYRAVVLSSGGYSLSPFSSGFDAFRIPRLDAEPSSTVPGLVSFFQSNPALRFVSDGDPGTVAVPKETASTLGGLRSGLALQVVTY